MKDKNEVIEEFNELINMTASELEKWLKSDDSRSAGWPKEDGGGESVGHDSGRKIVEILQANPKKEPEKYTEDQVQHMRKVVSYCKRHLAQEEKIDNEKSVEELKKTKSYASLKNWGHDILKKRGKTEDAEEEEDDGEEEADEKQTGDKRKATGAQSGANKKREIRKGESNGDGQDEEEAEEDDEIEEIDEIDEDEEADGKEEETTDKQSNGRQTRSQDTKKNGSKQQDKKQDKEDENEEEEEEDEDDNKGSDGSKKPKKGDTVSWNWGQGQPEGKVLDVKPETTTITTKKGNEVSRKGNEEDPAVVLDAGGSKAIKLSHELN